MTRLHRQSLRTNSPLEQYRNEIARCVRCGSCRAVCPPFLQYRGESFSARGRIALIRAVREGRIALSGIFRDRLITCTGCLACEAVCPSGVPVAAIVQAAKELAVKEAGPGLIDSLVGRVLKTPGALRSLAWLAPLVLRYSPGGEKSTFGLFAPSSNELAASLPHDAVDEEHRGRIAFFAGCALNAFQKDVARASVAVLTRLGYTVVIPRDASCCGRPLLSLGGRAGAERLAAKAAELISGLGVDAVVTACASCGLTFKREYPTLLPPDAGMPAVLDIHEVLFGGLTGVPLAPLNMRVTWHDPCHLGRGQGLSASARTVLRAVPGLKLVEMKNAGQCCGFGGAMRLTHRSLSDGIGQRKARDIIATGADAVVTGCPGCSMQIADSLRRAGANIRTLHTVQIIEAAMAGMERRKEQAAVRIG